MPVNYQRVWKTMNDLEQIISKVVSAREMIDVANESVTNRDYNRAEMMTMAAYEFLGYFIEEFDEKFKDAWQATVGDLRDGDVVKTYSCDKEDQSPECQKAWNDFWDHTQYTEEEMDAMCDAAEKEHKVKRSVLPVESDPSGEYFILLPDDLLEAANIEEGDQIQWIDQGDGSFKMIKVTKPLKNGEI